MSGIDPREAFDGLSSVCCSLQQHLRAVRGGGRERTDRQAVSSRTIGIHEDQKYVPGRSEPAELKRFGKVALIYLETIGGIKNEADRSSN